MSPAPVADGRLEAFVPRLLAGWNGDAPGYREVEGTLLYADVSGFTRLTERLVSRGKVGAEQMVTTISDVWEALLGAAGGGDVIKFAGDALILFFQGPDHALRACGAALAMQRTLARVGRVPVGRSAVRLRMSVGIHTACFPMLVVGDSHLELLVVGNAATTTVETEDMASAGEVLVSEAVVRCLPAATFGRSAGPGRILRAIPAAPEVPAESAAGGQEAERFLPPLLRDRLGRDLSHEHRRVAVAFAQVGGVDRIVHESGLAEAFVRLQDFTERLQTTLDDYQVLLASSDLGRDGAMFMMVAGAPDALGDEATRILRVAREIVAWDIGLPVRVGANGGDVFTGEVGPAIRRAYVAMGDTTNLAARTMSQAPWGTVLATRTVLDEAGGAFSTRPIEPFTAKGKRRPVEAALVGVPGDAADGGPGRSHGRVPPFVGRVDELGRLADAAAGSARGPGRVVEIVGEEGSGRSRLVEELRAVLDAGQEWHAVRCDRWENTTAYRTARLLLRGILGIAADLPATEAGDQLTGIVERSAPDLRPWLPLMAPLVGGSVADTPEAAQVGEQYRQRRAQQLMIDLVESVTARPSVIVVDDASHIDEASADLIAELLARIGALPWLAVVTRVAGTAGLHRSRGYDAELIELGPLPGEAATELALRLAENVPVPRHLLDQMVVRAGGSPLFLVELLAHAGMEADEMPHSVEGMISVRIDALDPADRQVLRMVSVIGERFERSTLDAVLTGLGVPTHDPALWQRLAEWVDVDERRVVFVSPLIRQVAYEGLPYRWRKEIHARVADALPVARRDELPIHLVRSERWAEAWQSARDAGGRARQAGANVVAAELYDLALQAALHLDVVADDLADVAADAGLMWSRAGIPERALRCYTLAIGRCTRLADKVLLEARRAAVHESAGRYPTALRLITRALGETSGLTDPAVLRRCRGVLHAGYASVRFRQGRHREAIRHAELSRVDAEAAGDLATVAHALHLSDRIYTAMGDRDKALPCRDAALPIYAELGDLSAQGTVLHDLAAEAQRSGRLEEARWLYERAIDARTRAGDVVRAAAGVNALGEVELALGRREKAALHFTEALRTWRGARSPEGVAEAGTNLGAFRLREGDLPAAVEALEEAERLAEEIGAESLLARARIGLAEAYVRLGRAVEAWERATAALDSDLDPSAVVTARMIRAEALGMTGGEDRARAELAEALSSGEAGLVSGGESTATPPP